MVMGSNLNQAQVYFSGPEFHLTKFWWLFNKSSGISYSKIA